MDSTEKCGDYAHALVTGMADFLITYDHESLIIEESLSGRLESLEIGKDEIAPVAYPAYADSIRDSWCKDTSIRINYIGYPEYSFTEKVIYPIVQRFEKQLHKIYESPFTGSIRAMLLEGIGITWLPLSVVADDLEAGRLVRLKGDGLCADISVMIYRRKKWSPDPSWSDSGDTLACWARTVAHLLQRFRDGCRIRRNPVRPGEILMRRSRRARHKAIAVLSLLSITGVSGKSMSQSLLEEVWVTAPARERRALQPASEISRSEIVKRTPVALSDVFKSMPSIGIRTNSRGEAVLRLRGSEERQTGVFLDGAPLSVPWDGRVDLSALPAGIIEQVRITASAAPIEYGPNSVLGVVDIRTAVWVARVGSLQAEGATEDSGSLSGIGAAAEGGLEWLFGGGYRRIGGEAVSSTAVIPYGRTEEGARVNTDLESSSLFVAAGRDFAHGAARLSLFSIDAERGIANAGHIDPAAGSPRYWRYPHWRFDQVTLNAAADVNAGMSLRSTVWFQHFEQTINQYTDDTYTALDSSEDDKDNTIGLRVVLEQAFSAFDLRLVGNGQVTTHDQLDTDHVGDLHGPLQSYQQNVFSVGAELDTAARDDLMLSAAISYDLATSPETGGRDAQDDLSDWAANVAIRWYTGNGWEIAGTLGQRTRFPTLRELYGEALGQFLLNPDLRPETTVLGDVTFGRRSHDGQLRLRVTPWALRINDTLSLRNVELDGVRLRRRYNLEGSTGHGIEAGLDWNIGDRLEVRFHANWQDLEARAGEDGTRPVLYQRPRLQASVIVDWILSDAWRLFLELRHVGTAFDEDDDGSIVELPTANSANLRLFRILRLDDAGRWRVYAGVDNIGDEIILPQLGLPQPGRAASLGISYERL